MQKYHFADCLFPSCSNFEEFAEIMTMVLVIISFTPSRAPDPKTSFGRVSSYFADFSRCFANFAEIIDIMQIVGISLVCHFIRNLCKITIKLSSYKIK
jgi:hypothetical protein